MGDCYPLPANPHPVAAEGLALARQAVVEHGFAARFEDELALTQGQHILVTSMPFGGWWEGTVGQRRGWFPANHVRLTNASGGSQEVGSLATAQPSSIAIPGPTPAPTPSMATADPASLVPSSGAPSHYTAPSPSVADALGLIRQRPPPFSSVAAEPPPPPYTDELPPIPTLVINPPDSRPRSTGAPPRPTQPPRVSPGPTVAPLPLPVSVHDDAFTGARSSDPIVVHLRPENPPRPSSLPVSAGKHVDSVVLLVAAAAAAAAAVVVVVLGEFLLCCWLRLRLRLRLWFLVGFLLVGFLVGGRFPLFLLP
jgi:hypothetical protein